MTFDIQSWKRNRKHAGPPKLARDVLVGGSDIEDAVAMLRISFLVETFCRHKGHMGKTADALGCHRNTITRQFATYGIDAIKLRNELRSGSIEP